MSRPKSLFTHNTQIHMQHMERKNISIDEEQEEFINEHHINLSSFVREQLDDLMDKYEDLGGE